MDELSLPRWYHGPLGNNKRVEAKAPPVSLTPEETTAWMEWNREENRRQAYGERQEEEKHGKPVPTR